MISISNAPLFHRATRIRSRQQALEAIFGYREFRRDSARDFIDAVVSGRDCRRRTMPPTAAGKSLTFQPPAQFRARAPVLQSPAKSSLPAPDRCGRVCPPLASAATMVNSDEPRSRAAANVLSRCAAARSNRSTRARSARRLAARLPSHGCRISLVVVDERHRISHCPGRDIRPACSPAASHLGLSGKPGDVPVLALTRAATRAAAGDIIRRSRYEEAGRLRSAPAPPTCTSPRCARRRGAPTARGRNVRKGPDSSCSSATGPERDRVMPLNRRRRADRWPRSGGRAGRVQRGNCRTTRACRTKPPHRRTRTRALRGTSGRAWLATCRVSAGHRARQQRGSVVAPRHAGEERRGAWCQEIRAAAGRETVS